MVKSLNKIGYIITVLIFLFSICFSIIGWLAVDKLSGIDNSIARTNKKLDELRLDLSDIYARVNRIETKIELFDKSKSYVK